jgi:hypothetical protein
MPTITSDTTKRDLTPRPDPSATKAAADLDAFMPAA